jgi:CRP/FNR family cyclic AMP-dependent transcriptional regulator
MATPAKEKAGSGLRQLKPGEILFNDGEKANSLFIIQKGQLRLFKPKGKGFIEIATLRAGEVIGEMAYFDDDGGGKRSCSASAMVGSEVIEISFSAFAKTMSGLNPWFKTIINTLANRLRQTNSRVKELESNSASVNYGTGKHSGYEFFKANDVIKILGTFYLVF